MRKSVLVLEEMKKKLTLLVFMLLPLAVNAAVQIDGIYYNLDSSNKTAEVARWARGHKYTGDIVIPSSIINGEVEYNVTSIVAQAFASCPDLCASPASCPAVLGLSFILRNSAPPLKMS